LKVVGKKKQGSPSKKWRKELVKSRGRRSWFYRGRTSEKAGLSSKKDARG